MLNTTTNLMDEYFGLIHEIERLKNLESNTEHLLKYSFTPKCPSELANQLRIDLSQSIQSRDKLEAKLDEVASELYNENNITLLINKQNDLESFINVLEDSPQFSEEAGGMIDNPYLSTQKNALGIFNKHFAELIS